MDELEWESLNAYARTIGPGWHGRVPLGGKDPPMPKPSRPSTAEQLASAHLEFAIRSYSKAIALARDVEERSWRTEERVDALRLRAMAHAAIAEWIEAIEAGEKALAEGVSDEVTSAELRPLVTRWRSILISTR